MCFSIRLSMLTTSLFNASIACTKIRWSNRSQTRSNARPNLYQRVGATALLLTTLAHRTAAFTQGESVPVAFSLSEHYLGSGVSRQALVLNPCVHVYNDCWDLRVRLHDWSGLADGLTVSRIVSQQRTSRISPDPVKAVMLLTV